jgi:excisionase family DNA binding protein
MNATSHDMAVGVDRLLTYRQAAKVLGVTERTVWSLVNAGTLPAVRFGRCVRIDPADLRAFIERAKRRGMA